MTRRDEDKRGVSERPKRGKLMKRASSVRFRQGKAGRDGVPEGKKSTISEVIAEVPADIVKSVTQDLSSRRLVEYFVCYSCKPRLRSLNSNGSEEQTVEKGQGANDHDKHRDGTGSRLSTPKVDNVNANVKLQRSTLSRDESEKSNSNNAPPCDPDIGTPPRTPTINNTDKADRHRMSKSCNDMNQSHETDIQEEELTPSRIRSCGNVESDDEEPRQQPINAHRGACENIHMPGNGPDSSGGPLRELYFVPIQTSRYPLEDHVDSPLNPMISHFCFPNSQTIELTSEYKMPRIHYFVLTNDRGKKMYGTCLTVYEEFSPDQSPPGSEEEELALEWIRKSKSTVDAQSAGGPDIEVSLKRPQTSRTKFIPKVICLLSTWPYLQSFREYISQLYRLATLTDQMSVPLERYILNICQEIPAPPPGSFEIRMKILDSTIRFWAPPANQPIPYVSLPFDVLFECLDANNVLYVWYALNLEQKVLMVSSQYSLLTLCAEILCSLIFPMQWSHLYIPILPRFLSPMLDAPMPYLCGISRENYQHAMGDISDETIIVDLDANVITVGNNTPNTPAMPSKRRTKLEEVLQENTYDIFLNARGLRKADVMGNKSPLEARKIKESAVRVWKEKLRTYDDAFNLAFTPNSESLINGKNNVASDCGQSRWDVVQEAFLRFYVAMLEDYRRFISYKSSLDTCSNWQASNHTFYMKGFIAAQRSHFQPFLEDFCRTQCFDDFITKRMYSPEEPDVIFFDQSITAKVNRSKMTFKKKSTPFLHSSKAHKVLKKIDAVEPNDAEGESMSSRNLLDSFFAGLDENEKKFSYESWPEKLDPKLFGTPRDIPEIIAAEFDRRASLAMRLSENRVDSLDGDFEFGDSYPSLGVATFTVYFLIYSDVIGRELENVRNTKGDVVEPSIGHSSSIDYVKGGEYRGTGSALIPDCSQAMCSSKVSTAICCDESVVKDTSSIVGPSSSTIGKLNAKKQVELDEAKLIATAQLDLAFSALRTMTLRKLPTDPDAYRYLMEACGRCGSSERATDLLHSMRSAGLVLDSEIYSKYLTAFTVSNEIFPDEIIDSPLAKVPDAILNDVLHKTSSHKKSSGSVFFSKKKKSSGKLNASFHSNDLSSINGSSHESWSGTGSLHESMSVTSSGGGSIITSKSRLKRSRKLKKIEDLRTTEQMKRHIVIGDSLLDILYEDLKLDTSGDACTKCSFVLGEDQIMLGWSTCSFNDYMTECPKCHHRFVARFSVASSTPTFIGSQGVGTPLYCEFLSPWVLQKEIHAAMSNEEDYGCILKPEWRSGTDIKSTLWWNLIVAFRRHRLAITFLLQGSFRNQLIMPMPDL